MLGVRGSNPRTSSPDGVADFTSMLMLMAVRNAKSIMGRAQDHD
jgi:D-specific alpha-keto acid dehydrogenase